MHGGAAYTADRAAALAGVPKSTVHYWAREEILVPSVSRERVKLWSYTDLMALRMIDWLRQHKVADDGSFIPKTTMRIIRRALTVLGELDLAMFGEDGAPSIRVDRSGNVIVVEGPEVGSLVGQSDHLQLVRADIMDLTAPVVLSEGRKGPDLRAPRPHLRIVPGKLAGAPHVQNTRVETQALGALSARRMSIDVIASLYPMLERTAIQDAIDLEEQLERNLAAA